MRIEIADPQGEPLLVEYEVIEEQGLCGPVAYVHVLTELPEGVDYDSACIEVEEILAERHQLRREAR